MTSPAISRRRLLQAAMACATGAPLGLLAAEGSKPGVVRGSFSVDDTQVRLRSGSVQKPVNLLVIADTHRASLDAVNGIPQVVAGASATGAHVSLEVSPMPEV